MLTQALAFLLFSFSAPAQAGASLMVRVTTPKGQPIPQATVSFEEEGYQPHKVSRQTGEVTLHDLKIAGKKQKLEPDTEVHFTATAAGYYPSKQTLRLSGNRTTMRVTLSPVDLLLSEEPVQFSLSPSHVLSLGDGVENKFENTLHATRWLLQRGPEFSREAMQWAEVGVKRAALADPPATPKQRSAAMQLATIAAINAWFHAANIENPSPADAREANNLKTVAFRAAKRWLDHAIESSQNFSEARNLCISAAPRPPDCDK
jgi:hypothetical protein